MNTQRHPHIHLLWAFGNLTVDAEQVTFFQGFESKIIEMVISVVD